MDILLINGAHPAALHISGVRAGRFAVELARMGHRCVLICPPLPGSAAQTPPPIATHDWSRPLIVEADDPPPASGGSLSTLSKILRHGGRRVGFQRNAVARGRALAADFRPQVGWATFGSIEAVVAIRTLAREHHFPWIFDDKDNPDIYVPWLVRRVLAWRLRGFGALQANSVLHAESAERWLGYPAEVVYSGVDHCFFETSASPIVPRPYVTLTGSLYFKEIVAQIVDGIARYNAETTPPLSVIYLGRDGEWLRNDHGVVVETPGYVSTDEMAKICRHAVANLYVFFGRGFHHKLFELLACRRPVIAYGGELPESIAEAERLHALLALPTTPVMLASALDAAQDFIPDPDMPERFFTWPEQAAMVEATMRRLIR